MDLAMLEKRLQQAKRRMEEAYNAKGYTDEEVLEASMIVDRILNAFDYLQKQQVK